MADYPDIIIDRTSEQLEHSIDIGTYIDVNGDVGGAGASAEGANSIAIGRNSLADSGDSEIAIGRNASCGDNRSIAIGKNAVAVADDAIQIGAGTNSVEGTVKVYDTTVLNADGEIPIESTNLEAGANITINGHIISATGGGGGTTYTAGTGIDITNNEISIDVGGVDTTQLADGAVTSGKIDSNAIPMLTGRGQLDLSLNTSSSPKDIADIPAGFYDVVPGGYICANPNGSTPKARKRQLPTGSFFYTDGLYSFFVDVDGETYLVDNAGSQYAHWGEGIHIDRAMLESYCYGFLLSSVAAETYLTKTDASSGYQPKNRYITNTAVALADWSEEATPTYADYPYKATITITGVTANDYAHIVWGETNIDKLYPNCNTVQGGIEIFASEPVAITIPTIKIEW